MRQIKRQIKSRVGSGMVFGAVLGMAFGAIALSACSTSVSRVPIEATASISRTVAEVPLEAPLEATPQAVITVSGKAALESTAAEISADDRAAIRKLGVPLVVPTVLPPNTYLSDVVVRLDPDWGNGYTLYYRSFSADGAIATCFQIEYFDRNAVGPVPENVNFRPIDTPAIARSTDRYVLYWASEEQGGEPLPPNSPNSVVFSDWIEVPGVPGGYRLISGLTDPDLVRACNSLDPDLAGAIASSLDRLEL
jgi:hypothetical protein